MLPRKPGIRIEGSFKFGRPASRTRTFFCPLAVSRFATVNPEGPAPVKGLAYNRAR